MGQDTKNLYKKVSALKDLKAAIKEVKSSMPAPEAEPVKVTKALTASEEPKQEYPLQYMGRKKILGGILSHLIGTGKESDPSYQMDVHLEKYNKGMPCIILSHMSPKGEVLDHSHEYYKDMKQAIKAIVNHKMKKAWK